MQFYVLPAVFAAKRGACATLATYIRALASMTDCQFLQNLEIL
jgi:hypothetical protein